MDFPFQGDLNLPFQGSRATSLQCHHLPMSSRDKLGFQVCCARLCGTSYPWAMGGDGKQPLDLLPCAPSVCTHHQPQLSETQHSQACLKLLLLIAPLSTDWWQWGNLIFGTSWRNNESTESINRADPGQNQLPVPAPLNAWGINTFPWPRVQFRV